MSVWESGHFAYLSHLFNREALFMAAMTISDKNERERIKDSCVNGTLKKGFLCEITIIG
jgi:hypothetical protein